LSDRGVANPPLWPRKRHRTTADSAGRDGAQLCRYTRHKKDTATMTDAGDHVVPAPRASRGNTLINFIAARSSHHRRQVAPAAPHRGEACPICACQTAAIVPSRSQDGRPRCSPPSCAPCRCRHRRRHQGAVYQEVAAHQGVAAHPRGCDASRRARLSPWLPPCCGCDRAWTLAVAR
jgi:hypothetical protein